MQILGGELVVHKTVVLDLRILEYYLESLRLLTTEYVHQHISQSAVFGQARWWT